MPTVADLKTGIAGVLTGISLRNVTDANGKIQRAVVNLLMKADIAEMMDRHPINLYDGVFDYTPPSTMFGALIKDARPQGVSRDSRLDSPSRKPLVDFDLMKQRLSNGVIVAFEQRGIQQIMRIAQTKAFARALIDPMSQTTGWTAGGDASGLAQDLTVYYDDPASLRFNLAANGTQGYIEKTFSSNSDLTQYNGVGVGFLAVQLPSATSITSIGMRLGSSSANYWNISATQGFLGAWIANDWLLIALDLSLSSTIGTVDKTKINYLRVYFNFTSTVQLSNVRVGGLWLSLPTPFEILFETPAIFVPSGPSTPGKKITTDNDGIILGDAAFNLLVYEGAREIALGKGGTSASGIISGIDLVLEGNSAAGKLGLYQKYRGDNPAQTLREVGSYYSMRSH